MPPLSIRGAWPRGTIRAHGSSLSLVLIKPSAHVRGVAPQASRAHGSSLSLVLIKSSAHVRAGGSLPSPPSFGGHLPQRGRRDLVLRKLLVAHLLGSPLGGAGTAAAVTERASGHWPARSCPRAEDEKVVKYFKKLGNMRVLFYTRVVKYLPVRDSTLPPKRSTLPGW